MQVSIIIVNYNVKYFLEQCLYSVQKAITGIDAEIIVVDNASNDGSIEYLQKFFPRVKFIQNKSNLGFAKANNVAIPYCKGDYILYLNPDTILPEECIKNCLSFFSNHEYCGALGVQMIDGSGKFLPESKRSFPSLSTAFYKLIGLSLLFPNSPKFNQYALGHLSKDITHEVDVLAGAFMMIKKEIVLATHGFDEAFFMYGEDIDLSYRIQKAGFKNYYFGEQKIIHFKGESTKRGSLNYVRIFYKAMSIFVTKHYSDNKAKIFKWVINVAIWLRAFVSIFQNLVKKLGLVFVDAIIVYSSLYLTKYIWVNQFRDGLQFPNTLVQYAIPSFTIIFILGAYLSGLYDAFQKPIKAFASSFSAIVVMLAVYSLLPENFRFSRGVILVGGILGGILVSLSRWILLKKGYFNYKYDIYTAEQSIIVGSLNEYQHIMQMLQNAAMEDRILGRVALKENEVNAIGTIAQLPQITSQLFVKEIIFCEGNLSFREIISALQNQHSRNLNFRFHARKSHSIVGSDSKTTTGEVLSADIEFNLNKPFQKRMKRLLDIWVCLVLFATFPIQYFIIDNPTKALKNAWQVFIGSKTWIGFSYPTSKLPLIVEGILSPQGYNMNDKFPIIQSVLKKADTLYAKDYEWIHDFVIIFKNFKNLGGI